MALSPERPSLQETDLEKAPCPLSGLGGAAHPAQQGNCAVECVAVAERTVLRQEQTYQGEVVELAQVADLVGGRHTSLVSPLGGSRELALSDP